MKETNVRALAAQVLRQVHAQQKSLAVILPDYLAQVTEQQQALLQELSYGSCRWFYRLDAILQQLMSKPIRAKDNIVYYLLIVGLYQLEYLNKPQYASVKETVSALNPLKKSWAKGLLNGILRNYLRQTEKLIDHIKNIDAQVYAHPPWLVQQLEQDWANNNKVQIKEILSNNNAYPPLWLRINQQKCVQAKDYLELLDQQQIKYQYDPLHPFAVALKQASGVDKIPDFMAGKVSVQDASAQFSAQLLELKAQHNVLDVCAAPGGKTAHMLEMMPALSSLIALDNKAPRLEKIQQNLDRLDLKAQLMVTDALDIEHWWQGQQFDRILLDVPCSATGVIRRNPDIKLLRQADDVKQLVSQQQLFLKKIWPLLKPGGIMLYATCSILRAENDQQVKTFLSAQQDAKEIKINLPWGFAVDIGWQILPGQANMDGFYFAKLTKT